MPAAQVPEREKTSTKCKLIVTDPRWNKGNLASPVIAHPLLAHRAGLWRTSAGQLSGVDRTNAERAATDANYSKRALA